jgi:DNA transposition AAA+ family ATPase
MNRTMEKLTSQNNSGDDAAAVAAIPENRDIAINVGGDQVTIATAELPEHQREAIRWLHALGKSQRWSLSRTAEEVGMDNSTLYRVFTGTYGANLKNISERIDRYRSQFEDKAQRQRGFFVETSIAKKIFEACEYARDSKTLVFVYGGTQLGKTTAALQYQASNNHGATKYVRLPASAGVQLMMKEFARACYVSPNSSFENLREYVFNALDSSHLVLVDELHQVFMSYQRGSAIKCLEVIREIHDRRGCGMVCFGTSKLRDELGMMGEHRDLLAQFKERGIVEVQLPSTVPRSDLGKIAASFGLGEPTREAREVIELVTKRHGLKRFVLFLQSGKKIAGNDRARRMTWDHFIRAHDIVAKQMMEAA